MEGKDTKEAIRNHMSKKTIAWQDDHPATVNKHKPYQKNGIELIRCGMISTICL